nr:hypothetical protein Itr_chr09CG14890 [Ipomoea trifida]
MIQIAHHRTAPELLYYAMAAHPKKNREGRRRHFCWPNGEGLSARLPRCFAPLEGERRGIHRWALPLLPNGGGCSVKAIRTPAGEKPPLFETSRCIATWSTSKWRPQRPLLRCMSPENRERRSSLPPAAWRTTPETEVVAAAHRRRNPVAEKTTSPVCWFVDHLFSAAARCRHEEQRMPTPAGVHDSLSDTEEGSPSFTVAPIAGRVAALPRSFHGRRLPRTDHRH